MFIECLSSTDSRCAEWEEKYNNELIKYETESKLLNNIRTQSENIGWFILD